MSDTYASAQFFDHTAENVLAVFLRLGRVMDAQLRIDIRHNVGEQFDRLIAG
jgi:hypothetical protein